MILLIGAEHVNTCWGVICCRWELIIGGWQGLGEVMLTPVKLVDRLELLKKCSLYLVFFFINAEIQASDSRCRSYIICRLGALFTRRVREPSERHVTSDQLSVGVKTENGSDRERASNTLASAWLPEPCFSRLGLGKRRLDVTIAGRSLVYST